MTDAQNRADPLSLQDIERVVFSVEEIQQRVRALGKEIAKDYQGRDVLLVGVLRGMILFIADLMRAIDLPVAVDFIAISRFGSSADTRGVVRFVKDLDKPIKGKHVLFVEDIVNTGLTLGFILRNLRTRQPASLEVCTLLDRTPHRLIDIPIAYRGFEISREFVVGYGLDYNQRYRNLPFVGILRQEVYKPGGR